MIIDFHIDRETTLTDGQDFLSEVFIKVCFFCVRVRNILFSVGTVVSVNILVTNELENNIE